MIVGVGACGEGAAGEAGRRVSGWICWSCRRGSLFSRRVNGVRVGERRRGFGPAAADSFSRNGVFRSLLRAGAARNMPISEKQLQANRAKAQLSTGPKPPEGKARVAANRLLSQGRTPRLSDRGRRPRLRPALEPENPAGRSNPLAAHSTPPDQPPTQHQHHRRRRPGAAIR